MTSGYEVRAGDCLVHLALEHAHTLQAGPTASTCSRSASGTTPPNTLAAARGCVLARPDLGARGAPDDHPWTREAAAGPPTWASSSNGRRRSSTSPTSSRSSATGRRSAACRDLGRGRGLGADRDQARHRRARTPGGARRTATPPRRRSSSSSRATARSLLWEPTAASSRSTIRAGCGRRPAGRRRVAHAFRAGERRPDAARVRHPRSRTTSCYYPRSGKVNFRGLGRDRPARAARLLGWRGLKE